MSIVSRAARIGARSLIVAATVALLVGAAVPALGAAHSATARSAPGFQVPVMAGTTSRHYAPIPAPQHTQAAGGVNQALRQTATFIVTYHNFTAPAKAAFQAAVNVWQSIIVSDQVIHVDASWTPLGTNVLGSAGPDLIFLENTRWYPSALHEARCHCNDDTDNTEIVANFNSSFSHWYLGTDGNTPNNRWDLESVVLHELGHGLGFLSSFSQQFNGKVFWGFGAPTRPMVFDTNEWDSKTGGHTLITQYTNGSAALKSQVTDGSVFLGGAHLEAVLGGRGKLYAPSPWQQGSSNSHFDEGKFAPGTANALMTPVLNNGESIHNPGAATVAVFQDIGWSVAGSAAVPGAPRNVTATGDDASADVDWDAPTSNGGSSITGYTATSSPGNKTCSTSGADAVHGRRSYQRHDLHVHSDRHEWCRDRAGIVAIQCRCPPRALGRRHTTGCRLTRRDIKRIDQMGSAVTIHVAWPNAAGRLRHPASYGFSAPGGRGRVDAGHADDPDLDSADASVTRGSNYSFRVRATDGADNTGNWTTTSRRM